MATSLHIITLLLIAMSARPPHAGGVAPGEDAEIVADDGAWCWFADPRAVTGSDATYAGWVDSAGNVAVARVDHAGGAATTTTIHEKLERDDHANPALLFHPDGRLMVFYSRHSDDAMRVRVAHDADSIETFDPSRRLLLNDEAAQREGHPGAYCYANPALLRGENDRMLLAWRGTNWKPCLSISDDLGRTWSTGRVLFAEREADRRMRPYLKAWSDGDRRVHFAVTTGHPRNEPTNSVHYFRYENGRFTRADGTVIGTLDDLPLDPASTDLVYDASTTGVRGWVWDVGADATGHPVVAYTRLPAENRHVYHVARHDGAQWIDAAVVDAGSWFPRTPEGKREPEPHYSGGIALDHADPNTVYLARPVMGVFEIERWRQADDGTWSGTPITSGSSRDNVRPVVVRGHRPGGPTVMWMHMEGEGYRHYTDYRSSIRAHRFVVLDRGS